MKSSIAKRSVHIGDHKTSVSLEDEFWTRLKEIAAYHERTLAELIAEIDERRQVGNLSSAIRLFVLQFYQHRANQPAGEQSAQEGRSVWQH
jgi:predicted DNA-binding ribbon-helix-helix protein